MHRLFLKRHGSGCIGELDRTGHGIGSLVCSFAEFSGALVRLVFENDGVVGHHPFHIPRDAAVRSPSL